MPRELWCRHAGCGRTYVSDAGKIPELCPYCERVGAWATIPMIPDPVKPYRLSENDRKLLRALRIEATDETDNADGA